MQDEFLALFPHRYDYIWADHPDPTGSDKLQWQTESRHPLTDRLIHQEAYLYGVRFAKETQYCLIDIDKGSIYHPQRDPLAISRIVATLESIGLVDYVACTSSYSGGIHLYFPFNQPQKTWQIAIVLQTLLENAGFKPVLGQLELFPNTKPYIVDGLPSLYAAHRLPMQIGSYLLNRNWETAFGDRSTFVQRWQFVQQRNDLQTHVIEQVLRTSRRQRYGISGKADKFLNDLNAEIEAGWTGYGQTNYLLGRIAMRSYVFGHVLYASHPLEGKALVNDIVRVATELPGYQEWCRHQHEIEQRAEEWARCVESSRYFHFGYRQKNLNRTDIAGEAIDSTVDNPALTANWNQQQLESARERIKAAIADLLETNSLPATATARFIVLTRYGIGGSTLYKHKDLWHPNHLHDLPPHTVENCSADTPVENPPHPPAAFNSSTLNSHGITFNVDDVTSLLEVADRNLRPDKNLSDLPAVDSVQIGSNTQPRVDTIDLADVSIDGVKYIQQTLAGIKQRIKLEQLTNGSIQAPLQTIPAQESDQVVADRMQHYLRSGDPILMAEAKIWLHAKLEMD